MEPRVGVDVGGTFTDLVAVRNGAVRVAKVTSTPDAPEAAVVEALSERSFPTAPSYVAHGTTVATNAVLERDWAETALVTTDGFRDVLEIGRQARPDIYDLHDEKPRPVVPRDRRCEVPERLGPRGAVETPLDEDAVRELATELDAEAVAVSLLFAFENPDHEERVEAILREAGVESVSRSSRVLPEIREYERTLATALNAGLRPVLDRYLGRLDEGLADVGIDAPLRVMGSNGGMLSATTARTQPVRTVLSGPAAGVRGAAHVAGALGASELLTVDMGGTSCDVSLVEDGDPVVTTDVTVGAYPLAVPMVDVHTVGAGGGSVAWVDDGGALRVGPRSAGADPGPVCYGRGGTEPTVTDAQFALGRIDPAAFLGDVGGAAAATEDALASLAEELGMPPRAAAAGVVDVANAATARALRVVSVERGYDPREFTLVAFGGAGPLHAAAVAADLGVPEVIVPRRAGVLSALGLLVADVTTDRASSMVRPWSEVAEADVEATFQAFEDEGEARAPDGYPIEHERALAVRYAGQSFDLDVPVASPFDDAAMAAVPERFHERHRQRYGHASPGEPLELVAVRVRTRAVVEPPPAGGRDAQGDAADAIRTRRTVRFDDDRETPVYRRRDLPIDATVRGPAVLEGAESTALVRPTDVATVEPDGSLRIEVDA